MSRRTNDLFVAQFRQAPALLPIALALLFLTALFLHRAHSLGTIIQNSRAFTLPASAIIITILALTPFSIAGCGGASTVATAPTTTTPASPSQTYTITVVPTAAPSGNLPAPSVQPITLTLIVN